jgi:hypothetical protein
VARRGWRLGVTLQRGADGCAGSRPPEQQARQLGELEGMVATLEQGSTSLNQRATTLASLAVAALGAFGVFASRIGEIGIRGLEISAAALLAVAALALLIGAWYALLSVQPGGKWSDNFAKRAKTVARGQMERSLLLDHLVETVEMQLERNTGKAVRMKKSYRWTAFALLTATGAVMVVLVDAGIG